MKKKQPLLIVAGPTATGKSDAAVELAARMNGAVISADSMQVYRGMDIGSAKITAEEMRGIPHYLIDCVDPSESWNVVRFQKHAREAVREIAGSGRLPILCGGTGFYIQALLYDVDFTEMEENTALRESLQKIADEKGPQALHAMLAEKDPASAAAIHPGNVKRVIRALEFAGGTGQSIADHNRRSQSSVKRAFPETALPCRASATNSSTAFWRANTAWKKQSASSKGTQGISPKDSSPGSAAKGTCAGWIWISSLPGRLSGIICGERLRNTIFHRSEHT